MTKARANATAASAKGDLVVGSGTDASTTLAVASTAGYVLTVDSSTTSGLKWATTSSPAFVGCLVQNVESVSGQSISNATFTVITFNTEIYDTDAFHSTSTNTGRMTIPSGKDGKYLVYFNISFQNASGGRRIVGLYKNGTQIVSVESGQVDTNVFPGLAGSIIYDAVATDYFDIRVYQTSGSSLTMATSGYAMNFGLQKVS